MGAREHRLRRLDRLDGGGLDGGQSEGRRLLFLGIGAPEMEGVEIWRCCGMSSLTVGAEIGVGLSDRSIGLAWGSRCLC